MVQLESARLQLHDNLINETAAMFQRWTAARLHSNQAKPDHTQTAQALPSFAIDRSRWDVSAARQLRTTVADTIDTALARFYQAPTIRPLNRTRIVGPGKLAAHPLYYRARSVRRSQNARRKSYLPASSSVARLPPQPRGRTPPRPHPARYSPRNNSPRSSRLDAHNTPDNDVQVALNQFTPADSDGADTASDAASQTPPPNDPDYAHADEEEEDEEDESGTDNDSDDTAGTKSENKGTDGIDWEALGIENPYAPIGLDDPDGVGIALCRTSDRDPDNPGNSIPTQWERNRETAERRNVELDQPPIVEGGESGQTMNRSAIPLLCRRIEQHDLDHVVLDDISRFGRTAPEMIHLIHQLRTTWGVTLLVHGKGELNIDDPDDMLIICVEAVIADREMDYRIRKSKESKLKNFYDHNQWRSWFPTIRFGYQEVTEDTPAEEAGDADVGWITPKEELIPVIRRVYEVFLDAKLYAPYAKTAEKINDEFGDQLPTDLDSAMVRTIVKRPVYAGLPTPGYEVEEGLEDNNEGNKEDESLQIVDVELFEQAREKLLRIKDRFSSSQDTPNVDKLAEEYGEDTIVDEIPPIEPICHECRDDNTLLRAIDCLEVHDCDKHHCLHENLTFVLNRDGPAKTNNDNSTMYTCPNCGNQRKIPRNHEYETIKAIVDTATADDEVDNEDEDDTTD